MTEFGEDLRRACRLVVRNPGTSAVAVIALVLGIGANTSVFGIVDWLLLKGPPSVAAPAQLKRLQYVTERPEMGEQVSSAVSYPAYIRLFDGLSHVGRVAGYFNDEVTIGLGSDVQPARISLVTAGFFGVLGARPAAGRFFMTRGATGPDELVAVISYAYWIRRYGGSTRALQSSLVVAGNTYVIVGVAPRGFSGIDLQPTDVWLPVSSAGPSLFSKDALTNFSDRWLTLFIRVGASVSPRQVEETAALVCRLDPEFVRPPERVLTVRLVSIQAGHDRELADRSNATLWLAGAAGIVFLVACANVGGISLAGVLRRRSEIATRLALGAGRLRLVRQFTAEALVLALAGSAGSVLINIWAVPLLGSVVAAGTLPPGPFTPTTAELTITLAMIAALGCAVPSAIWATRGNLSHMLKVSGSRGSLLPWRLLVVCQVALALSLVATAAMLVQGLVRLRTVDLGINAHDLYVTNIDFRGSGYRLPDIDALYRQAAEWTRQISGVETAGIAVGSPFGWSFGAHVSVPGLDSIPLTRTGGPYVYAVSPDYFATVGTAVLKGRVFDAGDNKGSPRVAVVNATMARLLWPGQSAVGKCFKANEDPACLDVVGVVGDFRRASIVEDPTMQYFIPIDQSEGGATALLVRAGRGRHEIAHAIDHMLREHLPSTLSVETSAMDDEIQSQIGPSRLGAAVCGLFAVLALISTAVGLYGLLSFVVARRTHEIGVRIALGATNGAILRLVIFSGLRLTAMGSVSGILLAVFSARLLRSLVHGAAPLQLLALVASTLALLAVAVAASYAPARRATMIAPSEALRLE